MIPENPLPQLAALLRDAATLAEGVSAEGLLDRAAKLLDHAPVEDVEGLLEIVAAEVETCLLRRRGSPLLDGGRMYVNPAARVYTRTGEADPFDALRHAALTDSLSSLQRLAQRLAGAVMGSPRLDAACAALPADQRQRALAVARRLLDRIDAAAR